MLRSGNSPVSWRSGVLMIGVSGPQMTPITFTRPSAMGIMSNAPGT